MSASTLIRAARELDEHVKFLYEGNTYTVLTIADVKIMGQPAVSMWVKNSLSGMERLLELKSATLVNVIPFTR